MSDPIEEALRANADLTEKALDFMGDPEQIEESKADIALWREAAEALAVLRERLAEAERTCRNEEAQAYQNGRQSAEAEVVSLKEALREIAEQQPETLGTFLSHGVVFDGPLGTDPKNWQHVAFAIYSDLCEVDSIARAALASSEEGT